jgi:hypothetical protein
MVFDYHVPRICQFADLPQLAKSGEGRSPRITAGLSERVIGFEPTTFCLGSKHSTN